ncbi:PLD nuclease N-terminal domain-containing protein [Bacillus massilinigeriensis]|uniref:PLD nuclease N-terminal domain-containing protein n=1 Tax=Bacillus mediterraneensis TaxID=1805474 RepID=UPI0008F91A84|nr:PLD nuclease N-terminal domain-containing protein [Bacillus mediterraneensis]
MKLHYGWNELDNIDFMEVLPVILPFAVVGLVLIFIALVDLYHHRKTRKNILMWTLLILFCNTIGAILYFAVGRKDDFPL